jgi:hypothetical protein
MEDKIEKRYKKCTENPTMYEMINYPYNEYPAFKLS